MHNPAHFLRYPRAAVYKIQGSDSLKVAPKSKKRLGVAEVLFYLIRMHTSESSFKL